MSADEPDRKRNLVSRNLRLAYGEVAAEAIPERFQELLRRMDKDNDDEPDAGIGAEPPQRPKGGPQPSGAVVPSDGEAS